MKLCRSGIRILPIALSCLSLFAQSSTPDLRGTWRWTCCRGTNAGTFTIAVQSPDGTFSGRFGNSPADGGTPLSGRLTGSSLEFTRTFSGPNQIQTWKAQVTGSSNSLKISGRWSGYGFVAGHDDFQAERIGAVPPPSDAGLNGCWNNCGVHLFQNGPNVSYSATWFNDAKTYPTIPGWQVEFGEGTIQGNDVHLRAVHRWQSPNGVYTRRSEMFLKLSADGNRLTGYYTIDGQRGVNAGGASIVWNRDVPR